MNFLDKLFGRTGNRMFQMAVLYAFSRDHKIDFYFQDEKWFKRYEGEIKSLYGQDIPQATDAVSVHVRRGDYVGNSFYVDLSQTEYYKKAVLQFSPLTKFLVFSDDIEFCKKYFSTFGGNFEFSDLLHEQAMFKMASCKHHIIANSSFSWWAAFLSPNPEKKVLAPQQWYADGVERTKCPRDWIRV